MALVGGAVGATALYRRYRPQTFEDVIGQEHVTGPLMQALRSGRIGHAYLFSGPRGCGKTTSARILARCLNCTQGPTPRPCEECDSCVALARGGAGSVDVIEIDAASHGGVEDARDLREKASYGPAQSRYRIYIIDEAHMVTPQGFNALLKIVEEPPEHVKFVFATTEPEKVIGTIRSRTHHYPFRLVPPARLAEYLAQLCEAEGISVEPGVLSFVIRAGGGSVRDSLSVLDQLMAGSTPQEGLTYAGAAALLGFTEGELLDATIDALAAEDGASVFRQVDRTIETGQDPRRFVEDLLERLRDLIVVGAVGACGGDVTALFRGLPQDQLDRMRQQAAAFGPGELSHAADVVNAGLTEMTGATSPRLQLELICARLLLPAAAGEHGLIARIDRMERRLDLSGASPPVERWMGAPSGAAAGEAAPPAAPTARAPGALGGAAPVGEAAAPDESRRPEAQPGHAWSAGSAAGDGAGDGGGDRPGSAPPHARGARSAPRERRSPSDRTPGGGGDPITAQAVPTPPAPPARGPGGLDTDAIRRSWPDVLGKVFTIRRVTWTFLSEHAQVLDYDGRRLLLGIATRGLAVTFRNGQHGEVVRQALIEAIGLDVTVEAVPVEDARTGGAGSSEEAGRLLRQSDRGGERRGSELPGADRPAAARPEPGQARARLDGAHAATGRHEGGRGESSDAVPAAATQEPGAGGREPKTRQPGGREAGGRSQRDDQRDGHDQRDAGRADSGRAHTGGPGPGRRGPSPLLGGSGGQSVSAAATGGKPTAGGNLAVHGGSPGQDSGPSPPWHDVEPPDEEPGWGDPGLPNDDGPPLDGSTRGGPAQRDAPWGSREEQPAPTRPGAQTPRARGDGPASAGREAFRQVLADQARRARERPQERDDEPGGRSRTAGDGSAEVSDDDEDIENLSAIGQPVIADVLGGIVISETES